jgi:ribose transport system ATP-binding protein
VLVLYDGAVKRTLVEEEITERALIASALNIATDQGEAGLKPAVNA